MIVKHNFSIFPFLSIYLSIYLLSLYLYLYLPPDQSSDGDVLLAPFLRRNATTSLCFFALAAARALAPLESLACTCDYMTLKG